MNKADAFASARTRRDKGIVDSILHAEHSSRGWADRAFTALVLYTADRGERPFTIEEFRAVAQEQMELPPPPDARAFGGVTVRALKLGVIRHAGFRAAASSNNSPKSLYVRRGKPGRPKGSADKQKRIKRGS